MNRGAPVVMAQIALEAFDEDIAVNAIKLTAAGSGNDSWDISEIDLVWDTNNDGVDDAGDVPLLIHLGGYQGNNGTLILKIPGDSTFKIAAGTHGEPARGLSHQSFDAGDRRLLVHPQRRYGNRLHLSSAVYYLQWLHNELQGDSDGHRVRLSCPAG